MLLEVLRFMSRIQIALSYFAELAECVEFLRGICTMAVERPHSSGRRSEPIPARSGHGGRASGTRGRAGYRVFQTGMRAVGPYRSPGVWLGGDLRGPSARVCGWGDGDPARPRAFSPKTDRAGIGSDLRPEST